MSLYATGEKFMKDTWLPGYTNQFENAPGTFYGLFKKQVERIEGGATKLKLKVGDSTGGGVIAQGGDFYTPRDIETAEATLQLAHITHTIGFDDEEITLLDSGSAAAAPIIRTKMDAAMEFMERQIERMSVMDGTGILARWASDSTNDMVLSATTTNQVDRDRFIWIDDANRQDYEVVNSTSGASVVAGPLRITNVAESTNTVTFDSSVAAATTGSVVVPYTGNWASGGAFRSLEFAGLQALLDDDNTYLGINRSSAGNGFWKATVVENSGTLRALSANLVHEFINRVRRRRGDGKAPGRAEYAAFASPGSWTAYHELMAPSIRYTGGENMPDIGWSEPISMLGIPLYSDIRTPRNGIMLLHKPSIRYVKPKHLRNLSGDLFQFIDRGGIFHQANAASGQGHAAKTFAYLNGFLGMYTDRPRNHGWLRDITEAGSAY